MNKFEEYKKELEFYAEKFAYTFFANKNHNELASIDLSISDISKFHVVFFFVTKRANEKEQEYVDLTVRCGVEVTKGDSVKDLGFPLTPGIYEEAIAKKVHSPEFGPYQHFNFEFGKPNQIQLFDAEFMLEEKLGL